MTIRSTIVLSTLLTPLFWGCPSGSNGEDAAQDLATVEVENGEQSFALEIRETGGRESFIADAIAPAEAADRTDETRDSLDLSEVPPGDGITELLDAHDFGPDEASVEVDSVAEVLPTGLAAGVPCQTDEQCVEGVCLGTEFGALCAPPCGIGCPVTWGCLELQSEEVCIPLEPHGCVACKPSQCPAGWCREVGLEGSYCLFPCLPDGQCPGDYQCEVQPNSVALCVPEIESCKCDQDQVGSMAPCSATNEFGTCEGTGLCTADKGLLDCSAPVPQTDLCDGKDNDCDGLVDEDFGLKGKPCDGGDEDLCMAGEFTCSSDGEKLVCSGDVPFFEKCDGKDNDCDGAVDEDFPDDDGNGVADCLE